MGTRRKARECALQMLFAADVTGVSPERLSTEFWSELEDGDGDQATRDFADNLVRGTLEKSDEIDELIRSRAEHWRIPRMAVVDRNILRMAVYEFVHEATPRTVVINEALEIARRFSTYEATQFINGILDAVKHDLDSGDPGDSGDEGTDKPQKKKKGTSA
jgi:N utilization substance protein B